MKFHIVQISKVHPVKTFVQTTSLSDKLFIYKNKHTIITIRFTNNIALTLNMYSLLKQRLNYFSSDTYEHRENPY